MSHTKGPWEVKGTRFVSTSRGAIAKFTDPLIKWAADNASVEQTANMRLIAAAPDLLECCEAALVALTQKKTFPADIEAAKTFLRAAIAKAKGEPGTFICPDC